MSQRSSIRTIAKTRLAAMGVPHVNKILGMRLSHTHNYNLQRTSQGRKRLIALQKEHAPLWRRVTSGSLAKDGYRAQMGLDRKRRAPAVQ